MTDNRMNQTPASYQVGYGKAPISRRFIKGTSGNPSGKPQRCSQQAAGPE